jgi:anti-sigma B factor antagonist
MPVLELSAREQGGIVVLSLAGELDIANASAVEHELARAEERAPVVVLDLRRLSFMDSTGLRIVVGADARARDRGGRLVVVRGPEPVRRVFRITRLDDRLEQVDDPAELV